MNPGRQSSDDVVKEEREHDEGELEREPEPKQFLDNNAMADAAAAARGEVAGEVEGEEEEGVEISMPRVYTGAAEGADDPHDASGGDDEGDGGARKADDDAAAGDGAGAGAGDAGAGVARTGVVAGALTHFPPPPAPAPRK